MCCPMAGLSSPLANPASKRGVHFAMPRPLRNGFVHLDLEPDLDGWCRRALKTQIRPEIIAFLRFKPELPRTANATSDVNAWGAVVIQGKERREYAGILAIDRLTGQNSIFGLPGVGSR
jgi:hypothetical protein